MIGTRPARISRRTKALLLKSDYSRITWHTETWPYLKLALIEYQWPKMFRAVPIPRDRDAIQLDLHSDRFFKSLNKDKADEASIESEKPASFVITIHPNGMIVFTAAGCSSSYATTYTKSFILRVCRDARDLSGDVGHKLVNTVLCTFAELAAISLTQRMPTRRDGWFLARLADRSSRFSNMYSSPQQARRATQSQYIAFAGGLAGGLIASSIFPTLLAVGKNALKRTGHTPIFLQPLSVLLMAIGLTVVSLIVIRRAMHRR